MDTTSATTRFITAAFHEWRRVGLPFLVLRNYEGLPEATTNDIDVLVRAADLTQAEQALVTAAASAGFRLHNRARYATLALYFYHEETLAQVHFDLFVDLRWRGFHFLEAPPLLAERIEGPLFAVPHPGHEAATNLLATMIYSGRIKEKYKASIAQRMSAHGAKAQAILAQSYGANLAKWLVGAAAQQRWTQIEERTPELRRTLIRRQILGQPGRTVSTLATDTSRLLQRFFSPPGAVVVLCGVDGCGKSTAATALIERLRGTFSPDKGLLFHWKPPVFTGKRRAARAPTTDPHAQPPRNMLLSAAYLGFHWLEYFIGQWTCIRPVTFRGGLVLVDRFYYDFFVDPRRYRLDPPRWMVRLGYALLKKPDQVCLLDAPVEVLRQRKQEVPAEEAERQRQAYRRLIGNFPYGTIADAARTPEQVAAELERAVLERMAQRARERL